jgi:hypothetical protein
MILRAPCLLGLLPLLLPLAGACSAPSNARIGIVEPDPAQFPPVSNYLDHRCGSLDCHGSPQRNLVLWGCEGLRLDPMDIPGCRSQGGKKDTTPAEYDATFRSLVGLEPTVMTQVIQGGGKNPELLTFVRKGRGEENHKGGILIIPGDEQDVCITSWLAGATNTDACKQALNTP